MLGKMAEFLNTAISWSLKTLLAAVVGLQIIRNLVAPVMDNLKRGLLGRAAGALPGVGNAVNMVTELVVTSAVLIRNCLGVVILVVFVLAGMQDRATLWCPVAFVSLSFGGITADLR